MDLDARPADAEGVEATGDPEDPERPDLLGAGAAKLSRIERANIALLRWTFTNPIAHRLLRLGQHTFGAGWVDYCTKNIRHTVGLQRLPDWSETKNFIVVSNHRSYFDLFVISMLLIRAGMRHRLLYPVRSTFFYDHPLGLPVNFAMSFLSMYPPVFRERKRALLNRTGLEEMRWFLDGRGFSAALHPEGTRNKGEDPYALLPAHSGVGRLIHSARVPVIPAFINGLGNDLKRQVKSNFDGTGNTIITVFGEPVDFEGLIDEPGTGRIYRSIAERTLEVIGSLGDEERAVRAQLASEDVIDRQGLADDDLD